MECTANIDDFPLSFVSRLAFVKKNDANVLIQEIFFSVPSKIN